MDYISVKPIKFHSFTVPFASTEMIKFSWFLGEITEINGASCPISLYEKIYYENIHNILESVFTLQLDAQGRHSRLVHQNQMSS